MESIILARHGTYDRDSGKLTPEGEYEAKSMAQTLCGLLQGKSISLVSSDIRRAVQHAEIFAHGLGLGLDFPRYDWIYDGGLHSHKKLTKLVLDTKQDSLIVVGHLETARNFLEYFFYEQYGQLIEKPSVLTGECVYIDTIAKSLKVLCKKQGY